LFDQLHSRLRQPGEAASLAWLGIALTTLGFPFCGQTRPNSGAAGRLDSWGRPGPDRAVFAILPGCILAAPHLSYLLKEL